MKKERTNGTNITDTKKWKKIYSVSTQMWPQRSYSFVLSEFPCLVLLLGLRRLQPPFVSCSGVILLIYLWPSALYLNLPPPSLNQYQNREVTSSCFREPAVFVVSTLTISGRSNSRREVMSSKVGHLVRVTAQIWQEVLPFWKKEAHAVDGAIDTLPHRIL